MSYKNKKEFVLAKVIKERFWLSNVNLNELDNSFLYKLDRGALLVTGSPHGKFTPLPNLPAC